jgi:hypothetical protein
MQGEPGARCLAGGLGSRIDLISMRIRSPRRSPRPLHRVLGPGALKPRLQRHGEGGACRNEAVGSTITAKAETLVAGSVLQCPCERVASANRSCHFAAEAFVLRHAVVQRRVVMSPAVRHFQKRSLAGQRRSVHCDETGGPDRVRATRLPTLPAPCAGKFSDGALTDRTRGRTSLCPRRARRPLG